MPHRLGGKGHVDNYLPICKECNRLRWCYPPEVIRLIMRLGIYLKTEIRRETPIGETILLLLLKKLRGNRRRRSSPTI